MHWCLLHLLKSLNDHVPSLDVHLSPPVWNSKTCLPTITSPSMLSAHYTTIPILPCLALSDQSCTLINKHNIMSLLWTEMITKWASSEPKCSIQSLCCLLHAVEEDSISSCLFLHASLCSSPLFWLNGRSPLVTRTFHSMLLWSFLTA